MRLIEIIAAFSLISLMTIRGTVSILNMKCVSSFKLIPYVIKIAILLSVSFTLISSGSLYGSQKKSSIAVLDFEANNISVYAAKAVSEFINTEMSKKPEISVVERSRLDQIFREHELRMTGAVDTYLAREIGKLVTAEKILIGTLTKTGNIFVITARVVDVDTGHIEISQSERCTREEDLELASRILSVKLINSLAGTSYSAPVRTYLQYNERNRFALGLFYRFGVLNGVGHPVISKTSDGFKITNIGMHYMLNSAVVAGSYEFTENLGIRLDFKYASSNVGRNRKDNQEEVYSYYSWVEPPHGNFSLGSSFGTTKFDGYGVSINSILSYPLDGFSVYAIPGIGFNKYSINNCNERYLSYRTPDSDYLYKIRISETVYTYFIKLELGASAYISRYVEVYLSFGVDYYLFSELVSGLKLVQVADFNGDLNKLDIMEELNIKKGYSGDLPPECYVMAGFNFRLF